MNWCRRLGLLGGLLAGGLLLSCNSGRAGGGGERGELIILGGNCSDAVSLTTLADQAVTLTNEQRALAGAGQVVVDASLTAVAQNYAQTMGVQGFTGHVNPFTGEDVGNRLDAAGYDWTARGENLEYGGCTAERAVSDWVNSTAGHREILLNPVYTEIGIGVYRGGDEGVYWVQVLASPG